MNESLDMANNLLRSINKAQLGENMDKDERIYQNEQAKIDKYETAMNRQCKNIGWLLYNHNIESTFEDQYAIADMENNHSVDIEMVDLDLYSKVEDVIDAMDSMR